MTTDQILLYDWDDFLPGDIVLSTSGGGVIVVEREVPDPEPELPTHVGSIGRATVTFDAEVGEDVLVIRPAPDRLRAPWFLPEGKVAGFDFVSEKSLSNFRSLVVLDPVKARKALEDNGWSEYEADDILHELRIEENTK